ncbi:unnamed protein product [Clonostachys rosea]|uniref:DUF7730 domain-containing protein n=1 Tax=Bionectria ochroleuca TaxID=29856 RepID=A0ABY6TXZ1_BIOOC|nr:unnamed protein product [Clonostachys rosea]
MASMRPPPSLLSLPSHVRKRIYYFADLTRDCPIVIIPPSQAVTRSTPNRDQVETNLDSGLRCNFASRKGGRGLHMPHESVECECPKIPKQLLLINKALHQEIRDTLYGDNQFVVRAHRPEDLEVLQMLPDDALRAMNHLLIRLNSWPCYRGHSSELVFKMTSTSKCSTCEAPVSKSDPEIVAGRDQSEQMMEKWTNLCHRLASCLVAGRLNLELICDVGDLATAQQFVDPLQDLPKLKSCAIRLGRQRDTHLLSLARSTVSQPVGEESPFPFLRLPQEVRLQVFEYTNLGSHGSFKSKWDDITVKHGKFDQGYSGRSVNYRRTCCLDCSFTKMDCICPLNYSSVSPTCTCRDLPLGLLSVNRQIKMEAAQVLFSKNMFSFEGPFTDTLKMLRSLSPASLKFFRRIRFRLEPGQIFKWRQNKQSWTNLISFIGKNFDTSRLLIVFDTTVDRQSCREHDHEQTIMNTVYDGYVFFTQQIKAHVSGLLDFHVTLGVFHYLEKIFEKHILGQQYDSRNGNQHTKPMHIWDFDDEIDEDGDDEPLGGVIIH